MTESLSPHSPLPCPARRDLLHRWLVAAVAILWLAVPALHEFALGAKVRAAIRQTDPELPRTVSVPLMASSFYSHPLGLVVAVGIGGLLCVGYRIAMHLGLRIGCFTAVLVALLLWDALLIAGSVYPILTITFAPRGT